MSTSCPVIVFAKAPVAGFCKTRLIPALGGEGAARLAERLLEAAIATACAAEIGPVELCCTPNRSHDTFERMARQHGVTLTEQGDGNLGARMSRALARTLNAHDRAVLIGTDAPALDAAYLHRAREALQTHPVVFGPASDGGYTLVGLCKPAPDLFVDMPWSTAQLMQRTRERLARLNLRYAELPTLSDVDEASDLCHVPSHWLNIDRNLITH